MEEKNERFKKALNFYVSSFDSTAIRNRFILLFSSLEALFNISKEDITKELSEYSSKILFLSRKKRKSVRYKIREYYKIRSGYIHGDFDYHLTIEDESILRGYVREILIIYWNISTTYRIYDPQKIKALIDCTDRYNLNLQSQLFVKCLRTPAEKYEELYNQVREEFSNGNYNILSNKNIK